MAALFFLVDTVSLSKWQFYYVKERQCPSRELRARPDTLSLKINEPYTRTQSHAHINVHSFTKISVFAQSSTGRRVRTDDAVAFAASFDGGRSGDRRRMVGGTQKPSTRQHRQRRHSSH